MDGAPGSISLARTPVGVFDARAAVACARGGQMLEEDSTAEQPASLLSLPPRTRRHLVAGQTAARPDVRGHQHAHRRGNRAAAQVSRSNAAFGSPGISPSSIPLPGRCSWRRCRNTGSIVAMPCAWRRRTTYVHRSAFPASYLAASPSSEKSIRAAVGTRRKPHFRSVLDGGVRQRRQPGYTSTTASGRNAARRAGRCAALRSVAAADRMRSAPAGCSCPYRRRSRTLRFDQYLDEQPRLPSRRKSPAQRILRVWLVGDAAAAIGLRVVDQQVRRALT